ncbi:MAG TPA: hypothetical protein VLA56_06395 [Pseudomonadales bacterium]|nr:hypothetical protein [Pseudomonadales bacterium]
MPDGLKIFLESLPLAWAMPAAFVAFTVLVGVIWCIPRDVVMADAPTASRWRDLRLWATLLVVLQLAIYLVTV